MEATYKEKLAQWGLEDFIENFESEGINDDSFLLLDGETIKALIPKIGPRLIFQNRYNLLLAGQQTVLMNVETTSSASTETLASSSVYSYIPDTELSNILIDVDDKDDSIYCSTPCQLQYGKRLNNTSEDNVPIKKSRGLEAVLNKYPDGQLVLLKKNKLSNDLRNKLTKVIITELFAVYGTEIKAEIFTKVAAEIETLLISEQSNTYYVPYNSVGKTGPKGKLYTKYINTKAALKLANASLSKPISTSGKEVSPEKTDSHVEYLNFLKIATEPLTKVIEAWEETHKIRRRNYMNCELSNIFDDFPSLRTNSGLELIEIDFNKKFPDKIDVIYGTWAQISSCILKESKERNIVACRSLDVDLSTCALLTLPFLFNPVTVKRSRKGTNWRPSRSEVQESFFTYIQNVNELEDKVLRRKEKLDQFGVTVQPFGVITGELSKPTYIIVVDNIRYTVDSSIRALELLYKLFHSFDIDYPCESESIWLFLQETVFKMKPKKVCPAAAALISDITYHLKK